MDTCTGVKHADRGMPHSAWGSQATVLMIQTSVATAQPFGPLLLLSSSVCPDPQDQLRELTGKRSLLQSSEAALPLASTVFPASTGLKEHRHPEIGRP